MTTPTAHRVLPTATVHRILPRHGLSHPAFLDRLTDQTARCHDRTVLTDNAWSCRKGLAWKRSLTALGATGKLTRPYRPQANGKAERTAATPHSQASHPSAANNAPGQCT